MKFYQRRRLPLFSQISAGRGLTESEHLGRDWFTIPKRRGCYIAVRINGESLSEAGILHGDFGIVRLTPQLDFNGQLAAVLTPDGLALKYCWYENNSVRLRSRNRLYRDQVWRIEEVTVQGVLVGIERRY